MPDLEILPAIKHLVFYPVKSTAGIEIPAAILTPKGLALGLYQDHQFMIVRAAADERGIHHFVTQRDQRNDYDSPRGLSVLALIKPQYLDDIIRLAWQGHDPISILPDRNTGKELMVKVWNDTCSAVDQGDELAEWLTAYLGLPVRLVKAADSFRRMSRQNYGANANQIHFQDSYPIHWFTLESVEELSQRVRQAIPWQSFRPQIVTTGMPSRYEHRIHSGTIAGVPFIDPSPAGRCPVILVNQETGQVNSKEPLYSLSHYKTWRNKEGNKKVIFGEKMLPLGEGPITLGDKLLITSYRDPPLRYGGDKA